MRQTSALLASLLFCSSAFAADPGLLNLVMPDAKVFAGINVNSAKISPLGQFLIARTSGNRALQWLVSTTGFDPRQDLTEILAATNANPASPAALLLVRGNFNVDQISAAAANLPRHQVQTYDGSTLIAVGGPKARITHAVAFIGNSIAVAGDIASVKAALDRNGQANSLDPALAVRINTLGANNDEWFLSIAPVSTLIPPKAQNASGPQAQLLQTFKSIQQFSGGVKLGTTDQIGIALTADTQPNAAAVAAAFRLLVALASMNASKSPHAAQLAQLAQNLQITPNGQEVDLALNLPEAQVETLLTTLQPRRRPGGMARPRGRAR